MEDRRMKHAQLFILVVSITFRIDFRIGLSSVTSTYCSRLFQFLSSITCSVMPRVQFIGDTMISNFVWFRWGSFNISHTTELPSPKYVKLKKALPALTSTDHKPLDPTTWVVQTRCSLPRLPHNRTLYCTPPRVFVHLTFEVSRLFSSRGNFNVVSSEGYLIMFLIRIDI